MMKPNYIVVIGALVMFSSLIILPLNWYLFNSDFGLNIFYNIYKECYNATFNYVGILFIMIMFFIGINIMGYGARIQIIEEGV